MIPGNIFCIAWYVTVIKGKNEKGEKNEKI